MEYRDFTSMPPEEEQSFVIYERTSRESGKKAMTLGAICGGVIGVFALMLFVAFDPPKNAHAVDPETDIEEEAAPAPAPAPTPEPAAEEPAAEEPAAEEPAAEEPAAAPEPPKGATKAPPTALIGK